MRIKLAKRVTISLLLIYCYVSQAETIATTYFNGIHVSGNFIVHLYPARHAMVNIENIAAANIDCEVDGHTLFLAIPKAAQKQIPFPIEVSIGMPYINYLVTDGNTVVRGKNLRGEMMTIMATGDSHIHLDGRFNIKRIDAENNSEVALQWISGDDIAISGEGAAQITVAGIAELLQADLQESACLHAKYLRAKVVLIHTMDQAVAKIIATQTLYAFAGERSNIYYYTTPDYLLKDTEISGNVLQLGYWQ